MQWRSSGLSKHKSNNDCIVHTAHIPNLVREGQNKFARRLSLFANTNYRGQQRDEKSKHAGAIHDDVTSPLNHPLIATLLTSLASADKT
jgi:hypothetical protein